MAKPVDHIATRLKNQKLLKAHLEAAERTRNSRAAIAEAMEASVDSLHKEMLARSLIRKAAKDEIKWRSGNSAAREAKPTSRLCACSRDASARTRITSQT